MRLLHIADVHLDRAFGGAEFTGCDSSRRRGLLRNSLEWAVDQALEREADVVTVGGDLFELEHVTSDTAAFVIRQLGRLSCPVLLVAGNHDYASHASPYRTHAWPANVTLALDLTPVAVETADAIVWGMGYPGPEVDQAALRRFRLPDDARAQLLVVHGVDLGALGTDLAWGGLGLQPAEVTAAGFDHALLGHIHAGQVGDVMSWPGSPVPLDPSETSGGHGALWVEASAGQVRVQALPADSASFQSVTGDVGQVSDSSELTALLRQAIARLPEAGRSLVTCQVEGRRRRGLAIDSAELATSLADAALGVRVVDSSTPEVDLVRLSREPNARGAALARLLEDGSPTALLAGQLLVDAFDGDVRVPV